MTESSGNLLSCVEIEPAQPATHAVIWLHGLGASGHDFEPIVPELRLPPEPAIRFVFPHAPNIPVTINMGLIMPAWYDVYGPDLGRQQDEKRILQSTGHVRALIARDNERGVPTGNILLAGFSQGGAIALHAGLRHPERLAGILALSCYLVREPSLEQELSEANRGIPIFQAHGSFDMMVPAIKGQTSAERLTELGYEVTWKTYPMGHEVHPYEIRDIAGWMKDRLGRSKPAGGD
jgi:phospholipase/carboxylesterase